MFIEKLHEDKPELLEKTIKRILEMDNMNQLEISEVNEGIITYEVISPVNPERNELHVEDFGIWGSYYCSDFDFEYRKFMAEMFGDKYILAYKSVRKEEKENLIQDFDNETTETINAMVESIANPKTIYLNPEQNVTEQ